MISVGYKHFPL